MKIELKIIIDVFDTVLSNNPCSEELDYFEKEVLSKDVLVIHSNEIGDTIGDVVSVEYEIINK